MTLPATVKMAVRVVAGRATLVPVNARGQALLEELADHAGAIVLVSVSIDTAAPKRRPSTRLVRTHTGRLALPAEASA